MGQHSVTQQTSSEPDKIRRWFDEFFFKGGGTRKCSNEVLNKTVA